MTSVMRDQVLALKAAEVARESPRSSPLAAAQAAAKFVADHERARTLGLAWSEYAAKYPSLGGL